jgi:hypothetical protein
MGSRAGGDAKHPGLPDRDVGAPARVLDLDGACRLYNSTVDRAQPALLALATTQPGWRESVRLMVVGDKGRFWIPNRLLGTGGAASGPGREGMLVFDIELLAIR